MHKTTFPYLNSLKHRFPSWPESAKEMSGHLRISKAPVALLVAVELETPAGPGPDPAGGKRSPAWSPALRRRGGRTGATRPKPCPRSCDKSAFWSFAVSVASSTHSSKNISGFIKMLQRKATILQI